MTDEEPRHSYTVPMIAATEILRPKGARVGHIGNVALPRPILIKNLFAAIGGGALGMLFGLILSGGFGVGAVLWGGVFGGAVGVFAVTYSPIQGESLWTWLLLVFGYRRKRRLERDGKPVRPAIGIAPVRRIPDGWVRMRRGAVNVPPSQYDERGVVISARNRNLDRAASSRMIAPGVSVIGGIDPSEIVPARRSAPGGAAVHPPTPEAPARPDGKLPRAPGGAGRP